VAGQGFNDRVDDFPASKQLRGGEDGYLFKVGGIHKNKPASYPLRLILSSYEHDITMYILKMLFLFKGAT